MVHMVFFEGPRIVGWMLEVQSSSLSYEEKRSIIAKRYGVVLTTVLLRPKAVLQKILFRGLFFIL